MCTLTWWRRGSESFEVFFNRDEKKTRSLAEAPRLHEGGGLRFLAPVDPDSGGTWMAANENGLVVCLLNRWHEQPPEAPRRSRGLLMMGLANAAGMEDLGERLRRDDLTETAPFVLVGLDRHAEKAWSWNGQQLVSQETTMPLTSSSFRFPEVEKVRKDRLEELTGVATSPRAALTAFHGLEGEEASAYTVRMLRPDARTMSRSRVTVGPQAVHWEYLEEQAELQGLPRHFVVSLDLSARSRLHA